MFGSKKVLKKNVKKNLNMFENILRKSYQKEIFENNS